MYTCEGESSLCQCFTLMNMKMFYVIEIKQCIIPLRFPMKLNSDRKTIHFFYT